MTRLLTIAALLVAVVGAALAVGAGEGDGPPRYRVVLDNAFGLTEGTDLRVGGVRVGAVDKLDLDVRQARAVATVVVERPEFGGLKRDATCVVEPQSLIGEYFMDCRPGRGAALPDGGTIPVEQTGGTVPPDLVNNILRRPYRERLGILIAELGATFAARGEDVNLAIRRAIPALRETDEVLKILADERETLRELARDGETVITRLARDGEGISRFVAEARDAASASADRREDLATDIRLLPRFQRELRPTLAALGLAARRQTPALADLRAASPGLERLVTRLGPFAEASAPAIRSLAETSRTGRRAVRAARPFARRLRSTATGAVDPVRNLRYVLEHLDDRENAVEPNPLAPVPEKGFTGLEAFVQYPHLQSQAINIFDTRGYILKINVLINECTQYRDANGALENPGRRERCSAALGSGAPQLVAEPEGGRDRGRAASAPKAEGPAEPAAPSARPAAPARAGGTGAATPSTPAPPGVPDRLELPGLPPIELPQAPDAGGRGQTDALLDLLLRP